jgi:uncharacterized protein YndB with AHSA1/START domain
MNNILAFDFSVNKENNTITVKREFAAPISNVWAAWTESELLDQWWAPKPWKARTKSMDFKEGGSRIYAMVGPKGEEHRSKFNFKTIEKTKRFTGIDGFTDAEGNLNTEMPRLHWEVNFMEKKEVTLVEIIISFDDLSQLETIISMGFKEGFTIALQGLDELLNGAGFLSSPKIIYYEKYD